MLCPAQWSASAAQSLSTDPEQSSLSLALLSSPHFFSSSGPAASTHNQCFQGPEAHNSLRSAKLLALHLGHLYSPSATHIPCRSTQSNMQHQPLTSLWNPLLSSFPSRSGPECLLPPRSQAQIALSSFWLPDLQFSEPKAGVSHWPHQQAYCSVAYFPAGCSVQSLVAT